MKKSHQSNESCMQSAHKAHVDTYGPDMTPDIKASLEEEIAAFDRAREKETLAAIEQEAVGSPDAPGYTDWLKENVPANQEHTMLRGLVPLEAEPDLLSEDEAVNLRKPDVPDEIVEAKQEIDELLSQRELQVWRLVMRRGMSHKRAASLLHIGLGSVRTYLRRAREKVERHFKGYDSHA